MVKYSIIIPTYKDQCDKYLKPCLESIIKYTSLSDGEYEVIVSANACSDNTAEYVNSLGNPFKLIWNDSRIGHSGACNAAAKHAQGSFIIKLDNDVELLEWGSNSRWVSMLHQPFLSPPYNYKIGITGVSSKRHEIVGRNFLIGFIMMIPTQLFLSVGGFDTIFNPGYADDIDLCWKVEDMGYHNVVVPYNLPVEMVPPNLNHQYPAYHSASASYGDSVVIERSDKILASRYINPIVYSIRYSGISLS
jgi:GT2 family glycosyltransferase